MAYIIVAIGALALGWWSTWSYAKFLAGEVERKHRDVVRLFEYEVDKLSAINKGLTNTLKIKGASNEELEDLFSVGGGLYSVPKPSVH